MSDAGTPKPGGELARDLAVYTVARLVLVAVLAAVIVGIGKAASVDIPVLVALLFGLITAMPLSMVLFKGLRARVSAGIAVVDQKRRSDKADLRARLRGDSGPAD